MQLARYRAHLCPSTATLLGLAFGLLVGCATPDGQHRWHEALAEADRHYDHGRLERARDAYLALAPTAPTTLQRYMEWRLAQIRGRTGDPEGALVDLERLRAAPNPMDDEWSSRALFAQAELWEDLLDDRAHALDLYVQTVIMYPDSAAALHAMEIVLGEFARREEPWQAILWLAAVYPHVEHTTMGDNVAHTMARIFDAQDDLETADLVYAATLAIYPRTGFRDDIRWYRAVIARKQGRLEEALALLEDIAEEHDPSWSFGEYDATRRDDAMLARVEIFVERGDVASALAEYDRILEVFPSYFGGARVAWDRAELIRVALADVAGYTDALRQLTEVFPESIPAERARYRLELLERGVPLAELDAHKRPRPKTWKTGGDEAAPQ